MTVQQLAENWTDFIPVNRMPTFIGSVEIAVDLYKSTTEPAQVKKELRKLEQACRRPFKKLLPTLAAMSQGTRDVIERDKPLPPVPPLGNAAAILKYAGEIQGRIISGSVMHKDRVKPTVVGSRKFRRPRKLRREVLTAHVLSAYVRETGNMYRRHRDGEAPGPVYKILEDVFIFVGEIDPAKAGTEPSEVDRAIRRHIGSKNDPEAIRDILGK